MAMDSVEYETNGTLTVEDFRSVLERSTLGKRRPVDDWSCLEQMVQHSNLIVCAKYQGRLIGVVRALTEFSYCCYISDMAVDQTFQRQGIGKELLRRTKETLGVQCKMIVFSAPAAQQYYPRRGFTRHQQAWRLSGHDPLE